MRQEIDIHSPSTNLRSASFTPEERASFASLLLGGRCGFVDCFRAQYPETVGYTYWSMRKGMQQCTAWRVCARRWGRGVCCCAAAAPDSHVFVCRLPSCRTNARASNKGWRLDHFLVSKALYPARIHECFLMPEWIGSDHCPVGLVIKKN